MNRKSFEQALKDAQKDRVEKPSNAPVEPEPIEETKQEPEEVLQEQDTASEQFEEVAEPQTKTRRRRRA